ncbi:hypothetical protein PR202_ga01098 [Eleusine coracana subsp. coracana]|nr:hypothetical protein PR202_ga01098 [Eleusine coracana subsp. coracana]
MNASKLETEAFTVDIPCGLIVGSSVTLIGTPGSLSGNFWIDLIGIALPGESEKPIVLHYNVRLTGDKITQDPVIVQSTFTGSNGWGSEDRCPCTNCDNATEEDLENSSLEMLKSSPIPHGKNVDLLIGIFSTANNFKRRMAIRRTWMQYDAVRQGVVAVRIFYTNMDVFSVQKHTNLMVNKELWNEAHTYGDVQTSAISAKYLMKTDDDAFVRVDEIQSSVKQLNVSNGLLYGRINFDSGPHRNPESKWYISQEGWPEEKYPPWAHGPGYVVSQDIAMTIKAWYKTTHLKMFKLEDVAMGIWVNDMKKGGLPVRYETDVRINIDGCKDGYIVAHYQEPRRMLCMWENLLRTNEAACCNTN